MTLIGDEKIKIKTSTMNTENFKHTEITEVIIKAFFNVYNSLGFGFLEKVYENALLIELRKLSLICANYIEVKAAEAIAEEHELQLINYLKATDVEVGLLLNFGKKPGFKRKVFSATFKNHNQS